MMTATEAYKTLGISRNTFYLRVKDLGIDLVKSGRNSMIQPEDLQRIKEVLGTKRQNTAQFFSATTEYGFAMQSLFNWHRIERRQQEERIRLFDYCT